MRFTIASTLSMAAAASAAMSVSQITAKFNTLAQMSSDANEFAKSISPENVHITAPELISDLNGIITASTNNLTAMDAHKRDIPGLRNCLEPDSPYNDETCVTEAERKTICATIGIYINAHQQLLNTLIDENSILSLPIFSRPLAVALLRFESVLETIDFFIIENITPYCTQGASRNMESLESTLTEAINAYSS